MKRSREESKSLSLQAYYKQRDKRHKEELAEEDDETMFYDFLYKTGNGVVVKETDELVNAKLLEVEREIDYLPESSKKGYFVALKEEIKQRTHYVRSKKLLMAFLRSESFDSAKAALRMARFFNYKLDLFGADKLPHRIRQDDLSDDDRKVVLSGFIHIAGKDCAGRVVLLAQRECLRQSGLMHEHYVHNITRAAFYYGMIAIEDNEDSQKTGVVGVRWNLNSTLPLKDFRLIFSDSFKMLYQAMPFKLAGTHNFYSNSISQMIASWIGTFSQIFQPQNKHYINSFCQSSTEECFLELSKYGINVSALPITKGGEFKMDVHIQQVEHFHSKECSISNMLVEFEEQMNYRSNKTNTNNCNESTTPKVSKHTQSTTQAEKVQINCNSEENLVLSPMIKIENTTLESSCDVRGMNRHHNKQGQYENCELVLNGDEWEDAHVGDSKSKSLLDIIQHHQPPVNSANNDMAVISENGTDLRSPSSSGVESKLESGVAQPQSQKSSSSPSPPHSTKTIINDSSKLATETVHQEMAGENWPSILWGVLQSNNTTDAIWWTRGGTAFAIEKEKFCTIVLAKQLKGIKWESFLRRTRRWGFERVTPNKGSDYDEGTGGGTSSSLNEVIEFEHQLFQKGSPPLLLDWNKSPKKDKLPIRLMKVLDNPDLSKAIWWVNDGKAFAIEKNAFITDVLECQFKGVKFNSFRRMLQRWGFKRSPKSENDFFIFYNPHFQRDKPIKPELFLVTEKPPVVNTAAVPKRENFPQKLYRIICTEYHKDAIWWLPDGKAFAVHTKKFSSDLLSIEYKGIKFSSFQRSMKRWGFIQVPIFDGKNPELANSNLTIFQHKSFIKDHPELLDNWPQT